MTNAASGTAAAPLPAPSPEPTHSCIRCGRPGLPPDAGLCEQCNPLELAQPSATQVHGIAVVGILAFVFVLAVLARIALAGTGPFNGTVQGVGATADGLSITLVVHNAGTKAGATTCQIHSDSSPVGHQGDLVQTPSIPAGQDLVFTATVRNLGTTPVGLVADCQSP
jgi:hypothetical protein